MNPYIGSDTGLEKNKRSPHFGRYRLCFNQVYPFREPLYNRLVIKIKNTVEAKTVFDNLPEHIQIIYFLSKKIYGKTNTGISISLKMKIHFWYLNWFPMLYTLLWKIYTIVW